jgi:hypothetical protein
MSEMQYASSLRNFKDLIRQMSRLLYTNPYVHLVIDFLIEH